MLFVTTKVDILYEPLGASPAVFVMMRHFEPKHIFFLTFKVFFLFFFVPTPSQVLPRLECCNTK